MYLDKRPFPSLVHLQQKLYHYTINGAKSMHGVLGERLQIQMILNFFAQVEVYNVTGSYGFKISSYLKILNELLFNKYALKKKKAVILT